MDNQQIYLPLLNLGGTNLLPLAIEMYNQLARSKVTSNVAAIVFKTEQNPYGDDVCVSTKYKNNYIS